LHKLSFEDLPSSGLKGWPLALFYQRARQYRKYRREISAQYTRGVHLFHVYYDELGERLNQAGILSCAEDIFYLYDQEIRQYLLKKKQEVDLAGLAASRREEMIQSREVLLPTVIYGEIPPPAVSSPGPVLYGTASSRGYFTGRIKVIQSMEDYRKMESGDILVIPYSDVGLTPLFAKAGAVIAESGGILSHSSIIAREYQIPAVVSVLGALQLGDDQIVTVDGYKGEVLVHLSDPAGNMTR
jgi:pyruvate,water dikinase